jgi:DNA-binding transcriptional LysR family regulator
MRDDFLNSPTFTKVLHHKFGICFKVLTHILLSILNYMEAFTATVKTGSFTAAAEQLGLSKSYISKQVSQLESDLGTRLLYRTTRKLSLSHDGEQFYQHWKLIMAEADKAKAEVMASHACPTGII